MKTMEQLEKLAKPIPNGTDLTEALTYFTELHNSRNSSWHDEPDEPDGMTKDVARLCDALVRNKCTAKRVTRTGAIHDDALYESYGFEASHDELATPDGCGQEEPENDDVTVEEPASRRNAGLDYDEYRYEDAWMVDTDNDTVFLLGCCQFADDYDCWSIGTELTTDGRYLIVTDKHTYAPGITSFAEVAVVGFDAIGTKNSAEITSIDTESDFIPNEDSCAVRLYHAKNRAILVYVTSDED